MNFSKHSILWVLLLWTVAFSASADAMQDFVASPAINAPEAAVLVIDLKTGRELASHNAEKPLIPASIMKCITTATLLDKTGNAYRYETPVYYTGTLENGVVSGNLVVKASGDPSINSVHEPGSTDLVAEITDALKTLQVTQIKGGIEIDESDFPGVAINKTWQSGDLPHYYGTGTHGFNFQDNASGKKSVTRPDNVFNTLLRKSLANAGISIGEATVKEAGSRTELMRHRSETIDDIMRSCMMRSDNQYAEAMLRTVGKKYGDEGSTERGASEVMKYWKKNRARMDSVRIVDGSGLSRVNRVTARFMADVLKKMSNNPYYASFFPLAGMEGTLTKFLAGTALEGELAMKTGSMNGIQCYAGYKLNMEYAPTHVVVVIMNKMANRAEARAQVEKMLLNLFK